MIQDMNDNDAEFYDSQVDDATGNHAIQLHRDMT
jgi:hypothetical protein